MASVKVAVRVRPLNKREGALGSSVVVKVDGNVIQLTNNKAEGMPHDVFSTRDKLKQFTFDHSYWSVDSSHVNYASQEKIFEDLGVSVVESAFSGYNACIFAYGQTGSGKTHTMMGAENNPGLTPRICESLFANMDKPDLTYRTEVSYLEIYNERVRDLLRDGVQATNLKVREHAKEGPYVQDLSRRVVTSYREIAEILRKGNINRTTASTIMNEHSSRSHAIFTIYFSQARISGDLPSEINSKIHLVDLAGSERADTAGTTGERLREGGSINKSLVILGNVISALAEMNDQLSNLQTSSLLSSTTSKRFIPYRNSVLTWLLKDSLGGNSRTVMVATISPADCCYAETLSTLRYAKRAKKIVNMPSVNEDGNVRLIRELRAENAKLKRMLADAMMQEGLTPPREVEETRERLSKNEEKMQELMEAWTDKWKEVINVLKEHEMLALRKEGSGVLLDSGLPYLLCIDDSVLSTGMKLYHIKEGDTIVGRDNAIHRPDIVLSGRFIENIHCIVRFEKGHCFLIPSDNAMCCIDSIQVVEPTKLTQGSMIQLGRNHFFRFNDPVEAAKLREEMNEGYDRGNMSHIWKDIQRAWSTFSLADSAIDSDVSMMKTDNRLKDWMDLGPEENKNEENSTSKNSGENNELARKCTSLVDAQLKIKMMSEQIENELKSEDRAEDDHRKVIGVEFEILRMEKERQEEEWCELEKQKHHQHSLQVDDQIILSKRQEHLEKIREVEKQIWSGEIEEMRAMMDEEVQQLCDGPLNHFTGTSCTPTSSDDSSFEVKKHAPASCHGTSFDRCQVNRPKVSHNMFECISLDGYRTRHNFPLLHPSTNLQSAASGSTFEDVLPSDIETFRLVSSPVEEDSMKDINFNFSLDFQGENFSNSNEDEVPMVSIEKSISNLYVAIRSMYVDEFRKSSRLVKHPTRHHCLAQQFNEKLLTISKVISRSEKLSPDEFISKSCDGKIELLENLLNLYDALSIMSQQQSCSMFSEAAETLLKINKLAASSKQLLEEEFNDIEMKSLVQTEVCLRREMFLYEMSEHWDEMVRWSRRRCHSSRVEASKTSLDLKPAINNRKKMKSICEALHSCGSLDEKLRMFSKNFIIQILEPGINGGFLPHNEDKPCIIEVNNLKSFNSSFLPKNKEEESEESTFNDVLSVSSLCNLTATDSTNPDKILLRVEQSIRLLWCAFSFSLETIPPYSPMATIGEHICNEMIRLLSHHCLVPYFSALDFQSIKRHQEGQRYHVPECRAWRLFNDVLLKVYNLQEQLAQLGFVSSASPLCLLQLLPKIRGYVFNRHKQYIDCALKIGISTFGVSVNVSPDHPIGPNLTGDVIFNGELSCNKSEPQAALGSELDNKEQSVDRFIWETLKSCGSLNMPLCSVSLPSCDIVKLLYTLLYEAQSCCPLVSILLQPCTEDIVQHFCNLLTNHQLPKNPVFDALLHNSCLFVAQHLMIVEKSFTQLSPMPDDLREEVFSNERNIRKDRERLKDMAERIFAESITSQKNTIRHLLPPAKKFACAADDGGQGLRNSVVRILETIQSVSNNWSGILSSSLYFKSIGALVDELVGFIIKSVLAILEFSEEDCVTLRKVMDVVINMAPNYFIASLPPKAASVKIIIVESVPNWMRMLELHTFLGLTLNEIRDRWTSGLGPLTLHFTDSQVISLIKAIFERTNGREAVIKEIASNPSVHITPSF